jgi:hypothetical protein
MPTTAKSLTEDQINLLKQALGVDGPHPFYRNFWAVSLTEEPQVDLAWQELVALGFAHVAKEPCHRLKVRIYAVTEEGKRVVSELTGIVPFVEQ